MTHTAPQSAELENVLANVISDTEQLLRLAQEDDWETVKTVMERRVRDIALSVPLLERNISNKAGSQIDKIRHLNQALLEMIETKKNAVATRLVELQKGIRAQEVYDRFS